jgi:hypothetical protein
MPEFGPMSGEGQVVFEDPELGDFPFDLELNWTKWDELGRTTEGVLTFTNEEQGVVIVMTIFEDDSRTAEIYREGNLVGVVTSDADGNTTYEDLTE